MSNRFYFILIGISLAGSLFFALKLLGIMLNRCGFLRSRSRPPGTGCFFIFVSSVKHHLMCLVLGGKRCLRFPLFCSAS